jgi:hypothetical protein
MAKSFDIATPHVMFIIKVIIDEIWYTQKL